MIFFTVTDTLYFPDGTPAAGVPLAFELVDPLSVTADEMIYAKRIEATTDGAGVFTAFLWCDETGLIPTHWKVILPPDEITGEAGKEYQFGLAATMTSPIQLRTILTPSTFRKYPDDFWEALKQAAIIYSDYRPLLEKVVYSPLAGDTEIVVPEGVIGIERVAGYGEEFTYEEVQTGDPLAVTGWHYYQRRLFLTAVQIPDPLVPPQVTVIWRKAHLPDERTQTFPTIISEDWPIVLLLAEAEMEERKQGQLESQPIQYTLGGTTVRWGEGGGLMKAHTLRARAYQRLGSPLSQWG
jgi:hypothetical protein